MLFHTNLNALGGSERVCLGFVEAAKELGFDTELVTTVPTNWELVKSVFGEIVLPDKWISIYREQKRLEKYLRFRMMPLIGRFSDRHTVTINTAGYRWLPVKTQMVYEHTTPVNLPGHSRTGVGFRSRLYYSLFDLLQIYFLNATDSTVVTNSSFCAAAIRTIHKDTQVLFPPVEVGQFRDDGEERDDRVVACGRYEPSKNYELLIKAAGMLPKVEFVVIGATTTPQAAAYHARLARFARARSTSNVRLLQNVSRAAQIKEYRNAKAYLHTMVGEDFGIAVVEAMAAGLIPIVHKSGGPWTDVVALGRFGFGYLTLAEAVAAISKALRAPPSLRDQVKARSSEFGKESFKRGAAYLIEKLVGTVG